MFGRIRMAHEHVIASVEAVSVIQTSAGGAQATIKERQRVEWFALRNSIIVVVVMIAWGYPLSVLSKRAGHSPAIGWLAGTIGIVIAGPFWFMWWLSLVRWHVEDEPRIRTS
jgi:hypothetical protein